MAMKMKTKKGFSLLELTLVLGVGTMVAFMKFQDMKNEQESIMASAVGQQMKQIGEAVNGYINIRYDKLSTLSNAAGTGTDPGPRTCSGSVCEITYQTLINEGLLPSAFTGTNANRSSYKIILKRDGTTPNYVINGLITTSNPWSEGGKTRFDLLGKAMQTAGIDSGMTKTTSIASGHSTQWSETSANFNNITSTGQLAFRVGYNSALYSVYLRRDGTLPMTGDLNLDGHNINNVAALNATGNITTTGDVQARDIKATGKIDADGNISAGNWMWAKNGYGDAIGFGGDGYSGGLGRDYEIKMLSNHPLTIHSPTSSRGNDVILDIDGNMRVQTDISSLRNITASGNIEAAKNVKGATLESTGRATVGEFVQVNGTVSEGDSCSTNGLMGRTGNGTPMYCIDGYWTNIVSSKTKNGGMFLPGGMKMMWGTLSENLTDYGSLDGLRYFESKFKTYEPTFIANGKTYKFSNIFSVQFSPVDVGGAAMERMWGTPYSGSFSYAFSSAIKTTMTGTYLAIGY
ncbi:shufflon system plasmid conjugative transfer pilus tip adhesin PilV [Escherichia coli]|nr:shufflon system plasmid conjugative transfer pilus tip adhesin PilV [Escherichia coli]EEX0621391.1 shufflon system plasmid conjugative transfer pilus tip adhesin PilV [Escherichia coli]EFA7328235.1 shufflon system plasmid conjugative transfer pilus tip adhesin PilV [Escherichia coli]EFC7971376.1 shufflon system plasmid conjugative transfer pilus tip adhesin PilV [Escherichia coli]EFF3694679.1 shufflon system plasmid conjugative transfer pilus tip adhesin PilV [Escherichia coli]